MRSFFLLCASLALSAGFLSAADPSDPSAEIDHILAAYWKSQGVTPNPPASDEILVRRLYLDIAGRIPTQEETLAYLDSTAPDKHHQLVDSLLSSEGYVNHFFNFWADILRVNRTANNSAFATPAYSLFIKESLRENKPYDQFVRDLITADGKVWDSGATGYYIRDRGMPLDNMSNTVRIFLGTRLECAQCHDHPFDRWTQMDYYQMAAFSYGVDGNAYRPQAVDDLSRSLRRSKDLSEDDQRDLRSAFAEILRPLRYTGIAYRGDRLPKLPADYQYSDAKPGTVIKPKPMFGAIPTLEGDASTIDTYAAWLTSKENPRFAKVIANRLWKEAFGAGLIEPLDDFTDSTEASIPELLTFLESQIKSSDFDTKAFLAMLFKSRTYARAATAEEIPLGRTYHFPGPLLRRMSAEQFWDSLVTLVNPHPDLPNYDDLARAARSVESTKKLSEALYKQSPEQLLEGAKAISATQKKFSARLRDIQDQLADAKANRDTQSIKKLAAESSNLRSTLNREVTQKVYAPFMDSPADATSHPAPEMTSGESNPAAMMSAATIPGPHEAEAMKQQHLDLIKAQAQKLGLRKEERKAFTVFHRSVLSTAQRAANLSSPAPRGHFLREFGQSDREIIENASDEASVPQALQLLNGKVFNSVANRFSVIGQKLSAEKDPRTQLDTIFLTMLARYPTDHEFSLLLPQLAERKSEALKDTIFALLNTQQFLFIQ